HVRRGMDLAFFERDEIILEMGQPGVSVFLIHKGEVAELDPTLPAASARIGHYTAGDLFGAISILNGKSRYRFQAEDECLCYVMPKALFSQLCRHYPAFEQFFKQSLS
ncbi:cyclic nucleotide-binding domain-containing protein, partial [Guyparkeria sp. 1SP6A2]|nr:cyclic nucleotide-binding domain-containing protein [Guyparkeria sp. 1SP6A2]